jgi:SAM-dependent methyltransferase
MKAATGRQISLSAKADRWTSALKAWAIPSEVLRAAPESPWSHPPDDFTVSHKGPLDTPSAPFERAVLPLEGVVLDIGCGGGRASLALVPPARRIIGVDESSAMLERFTSAAAARGVDASAHLGRWPDIGPEVPVADVVVCHHVVYNVPDVLAFLEAMTVHARLAVVVELTPEHPQAVWSSAWRHFWNLPRPDGPVADDLVAVVRALGWAPEVWRRRQLEDDPFKEQLRAVRSTRRRLCLTSDRDGEIAEFLAEHPLAWPPEVVILRWPGRAEER